MTKYLEYLFFKGGFIFRKKRFKGMLMLMTVDHSSASDLMIGFLAASSAGGQ